MMLKTGAILISLVVNASGSDDKFDAQTWQPKDGKEFVTDLKTCESLAAQINSIRKHVGRANVPTFNAECKTVTENQVAPVKVSFSF